MKKTIIKYTIITTLTIGSAALLMNISQHVQQVERKIKIYNHEITQKEEDIRVLKAEWAYLNNPIRLETLASKAINFSAPKVENITSENSFNNENLNIHDSHPSLTAPISRATSSPILLHHNISYSDNNKNSEDKL